MNGGRISGVYTWMTPAARARIRSLIASTSNSQPIRQSRLAAVTHVGRESAVDANEFLEREMEERVSRPPP